jgi:hypothetical protein
MAEKLMYLNGMQVSGTRLELARHFWYTGPPPKYSCFEHFQEAVSLTHNKATAQQGTNRDETPNDSRKRFDSKIYSRKASSSSPKASETQEPIQSVDTTDRLQQTSVLKAEEHHSTTNEETSENFVTTKELKREAKSENNTKGSLSKQKEAAQALGLYVQKQELVHLQEVATWNKENNRLKKEFSKLARNYVSLKKQFGQVMEENEQLKSNQEMEEGFQETSGAADQPICLDDEPKVDIELGKAKQAIETAANDKAVLQAKLLRVSGQLVTTQQEFADVQKNWQEQQQMIETAANDKAELRAKLLRVSGELVTTQQEFADVQKKWQEQQPMMEQQKQIVKLNTKLEDTERRFRDVAESLAVQTSELANERKQRRELGCLLQSQRKLLKDTKNFQDSQIVKEEVGFGSERKLEREKKTFRSEKLETYDV